MGRRVDQRLQENENAHGDAPLSGRNIMSRLRSRGVTAAAIATENDEDEDDDGW